MRVVVRADASHKIGSGHVTRCLALADVVRKRGYSVSFVVRANESDFGDVIAQRGFPVHRLDVGKENQQPNRDADVKQADFLAVPWEKDADETRLFIDTLSSPVAWLWVDHYALDRKWEERVAPAVKRVLVIDDLADRTHYCDVLLDQNFYSNPQGRYEAKVPLTCVRLLGPQYALLREEFRTARSVELVRHGKPHLFVFFGGSDPTNETAKVLRAVRRASMELTVTVVTGQANANVAEVEKLCRSLPDGRHIHATAQISKFMTEADFSLGAGGTTTYERMCVGLPSGVISVADNQVQASLDLAAAGYQMYLGESRRVTEDDILRFLRLKAHDSQWQSETRARCREAIDGEGAFRVADVIGRLTNA